MHRRNTACRGRSFDGSGSWLRPAPAIPAPPIRAPPSQVSRAASVEQVIEHGTDRGDIAEQFAPVFDGTIRCEQCAEALVAAHDDLQQILGGGVGEFAGRGVYWQSSGA